MYKCGDKWKKQGPKLLALKGTYNYTIDQKGRLSVPSKCRPRNDSPEGEHYIITRGLNRCLYIYPNDFWEPIQEKLFELKKFDRNAQDFIRTLMENMEDVYSDKLGRVIVPKKLLDFACIKSDVKIIGVLDKMEVWDPLIHDEFVKNQPQSFEDVAGQLLI